MVNKCRDPILQPVFSIGGGLKVELDLQSTV